MRNTSLSIAAVLLLCMPGLSAQTNEQHLFAAGGEVQPSVPMTALMLEALKKDPAYQSIFGDKTPPEGSFSVSPIHLGDSTEQDYIVVGRKGLPRVAPDGVPFWILLPKGAALDASNFGGTELEVKESRTSGYRDLELRNSSPNLPLMFVLLKYDPATKKYISAGGGMRR